MRRAPIALAPIALAIPSLAAAQSAAPGAVPVAAVPAAPVAPLEARADEPAPPVGLDRRVADDAAADRAFAASTALIAPSGTTTVTVRAPIGPLVAGTLAFSLSDRIEVGVGTVLVADEDEGVLSLHAKLQLWRSARAALAASVDLYRERDDYGTDDQLLIPSLVASVCTGGADCRTLVSAHLTAALASDADQMPVLPGLSIVSGGKTKLVLEGHLYRDGADGDSALFGYGGLRWASGKLAFDGGIGLFAEGNADVCYDDGRCQEGNPELVPWPFVGLSARL